jgi:16S rRNA (uracil1498-N3)-methyltransferase
MSCPRSIAFWRDESFPLRLNLILFELAETEAALPRNDPRAQHILDVLRRHVGDTFDAGLINGPRGKGTLTAIEADHLKLTFAWGEAPPPLDPIILIIGLPRPQTARKILQESTTLGVQALHFFQSEKGEANYGQSTLWSSGEWRRHLLAGAAQAFDTRLPAVTHGQSLTEVLALLPSPSARVALDNYEAGNPLSQFHTLSETTGRASPVVLALGSERGWSGPERDLLRANGFTLAHLGSRVLRTETACVAAVAVIKGQLGLM